MTSLINEAIALCVRFCFNVPFIIIILHYSAWTANDMLSNFLANKHLNYNLSSFAVTIVDCMNVEETIKSVCDRSNNSQLHGITCEACMSCCSNYLDTFPLWLAYAHPNMGTDRRRETFHLSRCLEEHRSRFWLSSVLLGFLKRIHGKMFKTCYTH